jgi:hypothetical protein
LEESNSATLHFLLYPNHPTDSCIGAVWELGTVTRGTDKGEEIETYTSYFSCEKTSQIPLGWTDLFAEYEPGYYHKHRLYRKIGKIRTSIAEIDATG